MRNLRFIMLITLLSLPAIGCYERVVSERPFAGMSSTRSDLPTAHDYSQAQADFIRQHQDRNKKPFDPIGDWIIKPLGSIGEAFSGGDDDDHAGGQPTVRPPARPATSAGDAPAPPPPAP